MEHGIVRTQIRLYHAIYQSSQRDCAGKSQASNGTENNKKSRERVEGCHTHDAHSGQKGRSGFLEKYQKVQEVFE